MELILENHEVDTIISCLAGEPILKDLHKKVIHQKREEKYKLKASHALYREDFTREKYERWKKILGKVLLNVDAFWMTWTFIAERKLGDQPIEYSQVVGYINRYEKLENAVGKYIKKNVEDHFIGVTGIGESNRQDGTIYASYEYCLFGVVDSDHCFIPVKDLEWE